MTSTPASFATTNLARTSKSSSWLAILAAGTGVPRPTEPGEALIVDLPVVPVRSLADYAVGEGS